MSRKIEVNKVADILRRQHLEPAVMRKVVEEMMHLVDAEAAAKDDAPPAGKKQFVILVSDPDGMMPKTDLVGWVLQIPEDESALTIQTRVSKAAYDFNASRRGRLLPVKTVGEAIESVPAKHFGECDVWVKTKTPVLLLRTSNKLEDAVLETSRVTPSAAA